MLYYNFFGTTQYETGGTKENTNGEL